MSNKASKGLYQILKLAIVSHNNKEFDFDSNFEVLRYEESIFDLGVARGHVSFQDVSEITKTLPIIGGERLIFKYKVSQDCPTIKKNFIIYKISTDSDPSSLRNIHTLHFVSEELAQSNNICIKRSYKDKTSNFIVKDLFAEINTKTNSTLNSIETKGSHHIIVPGYHPIEAINLIASMTHHPSYKSGLYYFFENSNGFNFNCVEGMMNSKPLGKFQKNMQTVDTGVREKTASLLELTPYSSNPDLLTSMKRGMFANKFICYDPIAKKHKEVNYNYSKNFGETSHLNKFRLDTDGNQFVSPEQKVAYIPSNSIRKKSSYISGKGQSTSHSNDFEEMCHYNNSVLEQLFSKHYKIQLKGDDVPSLWDSKPRMFTVGETMELDAVTKTIDKDKANQPSTYLKGKYLIHWCEHIFGKNGYVINARILSDSNSRDHDK